VACMLLRALGEPAGSALDLIRSGRPGSLSNQTFAALVEAWVCPVDD